MTLSTLRTTFISLMLAFFCSSQIVGMENKNNNNIDEEDIDISKVINNKNSNNGDNLAEKIAQEIVKLNTKNTPSEFYSFAKQLVFQAGVAILVAYITVGPEGIKQQYRGFYNRISPEWTAKDAEDMFEDVQAALNIKDQTGLRMTLASHALKTVETKWGKGAWNRGNPNEGQHINVLKAIHKKPLDPSEDKNDKINENLKRDIKDYIKFLNCININTRRKNNGQSFIASESKDDKKLKDNQKIEEQTYKVCELPKALVEQLIKSEQEKLEDMLYDLTGQEIKQAPVDPKTVTNDIKTAEGKPA